jgi:hypothetical protein
LKLSPYAFTATNGDDDDDDDSNSSYELCYDRSIIFEQTIHNNTPDMVVLDKITKEAYLIAAVVANRQNLRSTVTENLQKYTDLKKGL